MLSKKNIIIHLLSLCVLCLGFVLCRYVFFDIHGMKQLPVLLLGVGIVSVVISFFIEGKTTPFCTAFAYIISFVAGVIFQTDDIDVGGATTNNLWLIWAVVFVGLTLVGIISEKIVGSAKKTTN